MNVSRILSLVILSLTSIGAQAHGYGQPVPQNDGGYNARAAREAALYNARAAREAALYNARAAYQTGYYPGYPMYEEAVVYVPVVSVRHQRVRGFVTYQEPGIMFQVRIGGH